MYSVFVACNLFDRIIFTFYLNDNINEFHVDLILKLYLKLTVSLLFSPLTGPS